MHKAMTPIRWRPHTTRVLLTSALLVVMTTPVDAPAHTTPRRETSIDSLLNRASALKVEITTLAENVEADVERIEARLLRYRNDPELVRHIASAIVREARANDLDPYLLTGVLLVENPWLKPDTINWVGATGLMQVMPMHAGGWGCGSADLTDIDVNICHGARIFKNNLRLTDGDLDRALLRYNGCVNGTNTPDCHRYPKHVWRLAGPLGRLAWNG